MILYHGTSTFHLDSIRREGLQPRRVTKRRSNWRRAVASKRDFVYLTDAYPVYFAMNPALRRGRAKDSDLLIVKVEVDEALLFPDEDFIAWAIARNTDGLKVEDILPDIDPGDYQEHWRHSLEFNGIGCTPTVASERIIDQKIISRSNIRLILTIGGDASPTPQNYRFFGSHYRRCIETLFEHGEEAAYEMGREPKIEFEKPSTKTDQDQAGEEESDD